jgi:hypothetical protein
MGHHGVFAALGKAKFLPRQTCPCLFSGTKGPLNRKMNGKESIIEKEYIS